MDFLIELYKSGDLFLYISIFIFIIALYYILVKKLKEPKKVYIDSYYLAFLLFVNGLLGFLLRLDSIRNGGIASQPAHLKASFGFNEMGNGLDFLVISIVLGAILIFIGGLYYFFATRGEQ